MITPDILAHSPYFKIATPTGRAVVIHATRSGTSMNPTEFLGTLNWFKNNPRGVSAHWVIARDGRKARVVNDDCNSIHAGEHNQTHWGIELEQGVNADGYTVPQIDALVAVCKGYVTDFGAQPIHTFSSSASGFIGHQETIQGMREGKSDPGTGFPWAYFINALSGTTPPPPPPPVTVERLLDALQAATARAWVDQRIDTAPDHDKEVLKKVYG